MLKLLILIVLAYLVFRAFKNRIDADRISTPRPAAGEMDDAMVQDPFCGCFFPKRDGVHVQLDGQDLYFCSEACKQNFMSDDRVEKT